MISYLQIEELTKSFGDLVLFENLSFGISEGDQNRAYCQKWNRENHSAQHNSGKRRLRFRECNLPQGLAGRLSGTNAGISAGTNRLKPAFIHKTKRFRSYRNMSRL